MSERRFYFRELLEEEWTCPQVKSEYLVTKSELARRIYKITNELAEENITIGTAIDILLHGEKEQPKRTDSLRRAWRDCCDCVHEEEIGTLSCHECFDDPARPIWESKEQPDEWEEWINRFPWVYLDGCTVMGTGKDNGADKMRQWFLTIPCNPRRKP